jgi:hypothetical protein
MDGEGGGEKKRDGGAMFRMTHGDGLGVDRVQRSNRSKTFIRRRSLENYR